jgi:hypothetical protein
MLEEWDFYSYDVQRLSMMQYMEGQRRTWRVLVWRPHNTQQHNEEVEIRTWNKEDSVR